MHADLSQLEGYTERFFLPFYGKMGWHHTIRETKDGREVTFKIEVSGPSALILAPIMRNIKMTCRQRLISSSLLLRKHETAVVTPTAWLRSLATG